MCGQCRSGVVETDWYTEGAIDTLAGRRAARTNLADAMDAALRGLGLRARSHPGMLSITLSTASGRSAMVAGLGQVQSSIAALVGRPLDPLDESSIRHRADAGNR
jgi:hypothetical protein